MPKTFYIVYSIKGRSGSGFGRNTLTADRDIDTMERIEVVEKELLKAVQELHPEEQYSNLFIVNWRELSATVAPSLEHSNGNRAEGE